MVAGARKEGPELPSLLLPNSEHSCSETSLFIASGVRLDSIARLCGYKQFRNKTVSPDPRAYAPRPVQLDEPHCSHCIRVALHEAALERHLDLFFRSGLDNQAEIFFLPFDSS